MERDTPSLHQLVDAALTRGARAHEASRLLLADNARLGRELLVLLDLIEERRRAAARRRRSETDSSGV